MGLLLFCELEGVGQLEEWDCIIKDIKKNNGK